MELLFSELVKLPCDNCGYVLFLDAGKVSQEPEGDAVEEADLYPLFTQVPRRAVLGNPYAGSCIKLPLGASDSQLSHLRACLVRNRVGFRGAENRLSVGMEGGQRLFLLGSFLGVRA